MSMFVAISTYLKPLEELDRVYPEHYAWLEKHYATGRFMGSGRRVPPLGGLIIARAGNREEFQAALAGDPFQQHELARYEIFEFTPGPIPRRSAELEAFLGKSLGPA
jgi:uncharacterized protein YciI